MGDRESPMDAGIPPLRPLDEATKAKAQRVVERCCRDAVERETFRAMLGLLPGGTT
jgi:hypothetical protein